MALLLLEQVKINQTSPNMVMYMILEPFMTELSKMNYLLLLIFIFNQDGSV